MPLPNAITALLSGTLVESERMELKEGWNPKSVLHTLCAFAYDFHNLGGGYVIIGVAKKDGHSQLPPVGLTPEQIDAIQKEVLNRGHFAIQPYYHPVMEPAVIDGNTSSSCGHPVGRHVLTSPGSRLGKPKPSGHITFEKVRTPSAPKAASRANFSALRTTSLSTIE